jgi:hypothetical protein
LAGSRAGALLVAGALAIGGCGDDGLGDPPAGGASDTRPAERTTTPRREAPDRPRLKTARCPASYAGPNCAASRGRVIYVESVDADGDGDLHAVTTWTGGDKVTGGGLVIFDVRRGLRPRRDPRPGDEVTGWGPVYRGSYGQRQIESREFRVARR